MQLFEKEGLWGYKDDNGKIVIEPKFVKARDFKNGFAVVASDYNVKYDYRRYECKTPRFIYIDETGRDVFQRSFEEACDFSDTGYAWARKNSWVDNKIILLPSMVEIIHPIGDKMYFSLLKNGWGYAYSTMGISAKSIKGVTSLYDQNGKILKSEESYGGFKTDPEEPNPSFVVSDFSDGLLKISFDSEIIFVDENFNTALSIPKDKYKSVGNFNKGKAKIVSWKEKFTFFNIETLTTKEVIGKPSKSQYAGYYLIDGVYYDKFGNTITSEEIIRRSTKQSNIPFFINDRAIVDNYEYKELPKNDHNKIIDIAGNTIDLIAGKILKSDKSSIVFNNSLYGFIDKEDNLIIEANLENVEEFDETGKCKVVKNGIRGYINNGGQFFQIDSVYSNSK